MKFILFTVLLILVSSCKWSNKSQLKGLSCAPSKKMTFEDDILSFRYQDNYIHIRNSSAGSSALSVHERLQDASAFVEVNGAIKETKLIVEPIDELFVVLRTPDNSLNMTIQVFERIKFGERQITLLVPTDPRLVKVSSRDTSIDAISIELLTGEWWEEEFEYLAYVEAKAKAANGDSRGLIGGFCPTGFNPSLILPGLATGNSRRSPLTGSCHAVATSNIASKILEVKGILRPNEIIHPSFWSLHYWTDMKGSTIEAMVNHESKQIEDIVAGVRSGRISKDPMKLKKHIKMKIIEEQSGLPSRSVDMMNVTQLPIIKKADIDPSAYNNIIAMTNSLISLRYNIVLSKIKGRAYSKAALPIFYSELDKLKQNFFNSRVRLLAFNKLASKEVRFTSEQGSVDIFNEALESGPLVANLNGHAVTVIKRGEDKITIFDSDSAVGTDSIRSIDDSVFFNNLSSYFIISVTN